MSEILTALKQLGVSDEVLTTLADAPIFEERFTPFSTDFDITQTIDPSEVPVNNPSPSFLRTGLLQV